MSKIKAKLELDSTGFKAGLNSAKSSLASFKTGVGAIATGAAAAFAAIGAGAALLGAGLKNAFDVGGALSDLSSQTGASVASLAVLQQAFKNSGLEAGKVGPAVAKMRKSITGAMEGGKAGEGFAKLGLDAKELAGMGAAEQLQAIGEAINGIQNPTAKAAAAMEIFGKSGAEMLTLFADSSAMASAAEQVGNQAEILDKNAALFDDISDKLNTVSLKIQGFFVGMGSAVAPAIKSAVDAFAKIDLSGIGKQVGDAVAMLIAAFQGGEIGAIVSASLRIGAADFINAILRGWAGLGRVISSLLQAAALAFTGAMFQALADISSPALWKGLENGLVAAAKLFGQAMLEAVMGPLKVLREIPGVAKLLAGAFKEAEGIGASLVPKPTNGKGFSAAATDMARQNNERAAGLLGNLGNAFKQGGAGAFQIDTSGDRATLNASLESIRGIAEQNRAAAEAFSAANQKGDNSVDEDASPIAPLAAVVQNIGAAFTSSLARISGGGASVGGSDPILSESRRQSSLLEQIRKNTLPAKQVAPNLTARFA